MKRTTSEIQLINPAMTEWTVKPGDKVSVFSPEGDPRDPSTNLSQAYIVPEPFVLQPLYLSGFIQTDPLSKIDIDRLQPYLTTDISESLILEINRAIDDFVCTVGLQSRLATWKQIETQLQLVLDTCDSVLFGIQTLARLTDPKVLDNSVSQGALSADRLVKHMLTDQIASKEIILQIDLSPIRLSCIRALADVKSKIKRGRKPESVFRLFLGRLANAMKEEGFEVKVPWNESVPDKAHPSFLFVNNVLSICIEKGKAAINGSDLKETEKSEAIRALSHHRKSFRAIGHYFRDGSLG
ncbi:hypothetical protein FV226_26635 [Methylobacterium sp. WL12]|uniref:hypothetical protein n=1 Tax=Methylobacterium sp. WL12 TaxID=2603890 RepID=UPI0011C7D93F|nr:hypothetical protein [Methylobacterium sp. WL12]TXM64348.1 hypothetical protein FV226_26635 [Methylobacterium sp. WL12]